MILDGDVAKPVSDTIQDNQDVTTEIEYLGVPWRIAYMDLQKEFTLLVVILVP